MSLPSSLLSYQPQLDFMEHALDQDRGARMYFRDENHATIFRMRCHHARALHRKENKLIHDEGTALWGKSEYDILMFTIRASQDGFWVYAEKQILDTSRVEPIPEEDYAPLDPDEIKFEEDANGDQAAE